MMGSFLLVHCLYALDPHGVTMGIGTCSNMSCRISAVWLLLCATVFADDEAVFHLQSTVNAYGTLEFRADSVLSLQAQGSPSRSQSSTMTFRRDSSRVFVSVERAEEDNKRHRAEWILADRELLTFQAVLDSHTLKLDDATREFAIIRLKSQRIADGGEYENPTLELLLSNFNDSVLPLGFIGGAFITDYVRSDAEVAVTESLGLIRVYSKSRRGELELRLDPDYGYLPRTLRLRQRGLEIAQGGDGVTEVNWFADNIVLDRQDGIPFIRNVVVLKRVLRGEQVISELETATEVEQIDFGPAFASRDFVTTIDFPKGHRVNVAGASHLPYVWNGTRPVPELGDTSGVGDTITHSGSRWILLVANIIVLGVSLSVLLYWRWRARRSSSRR